MGSGKGGSHFSQFPPFPIPFPRILPFSGSHFSQFPLFLIPFFPIPPFPDPMFPKALNPALWSLIQKTLTTLNSGKIGNFATDRHSPPQRLVWIIGDAWQRDKGWRMSHGDVVRGTVGEHLRLPRAPFGGTAALFPTSSRFSLCYFHSRRIAPSGPGGRCGLKCPFPRGSLYVGALCSVGTRHGSGTLWCSLFTNNAGISGGYNLGGEVFGAPKFWCLAVAGTFGRPRVGERCMGTLRYEGHDKSTMPEVSSPL